MNKILLLPILVFIHLSTQGLAQTCQGLFSENTNINPRTQQSELIQLKLEQLSGTRFDQQQVTEVLRLITDDPTSFPHIENARVKTYWFSKRLKWSITPPFMELELKDPKYIKQFTFKRSKIKVPAHLPKEKKELLEFLFEYSLSIEQYYRNINSLLSHSKVKLIKENFHAYEVANRARLFATQMMIDSLHTSPVQRLLFSGLKIWIHIEAATIAIIKSHNPKSYVAELNKVMKKYHEDLTKVYSLIASEIPASEIVARHNTPVAGRPNIFSRAWNSDSIQAIWGNWHILLPFTYFRPLEDQTFQVSKPIDAHKRAWSLYSKFISDHFVTKSLLAYSLFIAVVPVEIYINAKEIEAHTKEGIELVDKIDLKDIESDFQKNYEARRRLREESREENKDTP